MNCREVAAPAVQQATTTSQLLPRQNDDSSTEATNQRPRNDKRNTLRPSVGDQAQTLPLTKFNIDMAFNELQQVHHPK